MSEGNVTNGATSSATAAPVGNQNVGTPTTTAPDWTAALNEDTRGYVQTKGFKDPATVLDSYRNLEKLMGAPKERLLKLPEKDDDAQGWGEVYDRLGRPRDAKEYDIKLPEGMQDDKFAQWAKSAFHELGISKKAGDKLAGKWSEYIAGTQKVSVEAQQAKVAEEGTNLKKEWGAAYEQNVNAAKNAAAVFAVKGEIIDKIEGALGFAETMKLFQNIGVKMGEDKFVSGQSRQTDFTGALAPEAARYRIKALQSDPEFVKKYTSGDLSSREEFERLHRYAFPDAS